MNRRALSLTLAALIGAGTAAAPLVASPAADRRAAERGAAWLARTPAAVPGGQIADTIVALRATGYSRAAVRPRLRALARTAPRYATTPGRAAKVVLGSLAAGANPTRLGRRNYIGRIYAGYAGGRFGDSSFEHALSLLALRAAGRPVPRRTVRVTLAARGRGGWGFSLSPAGSDSVDATGLVLEALRATGVPARHPHMRAATRWMLDQRNSRGGYASAGRGGATQANPTSNVIRALRSMGISPPAPTRAELRRLQTRSGAVRFTGRRAGSPLLATTDAVVALSGRTLPVR